MFKSSFFLPLIFLPTLLTAQFNFNAPLALTDDSEQFRLSRNPNGIAQFDSLNTLHITYWSGGIATNPSTPSSIYYNSWSATGGVGVAEEIDDSFVDLGSGPQKSGGRQPSLTITPDDDIWITWHDTRDADPNPPGNSIDNLEIYADVRPFGGSFSSTDIRLTNTSAAHFGDNAYLPKISAAPDGSVSVLWYDFNADGDISDLYLFDSDTSGAFNIAAPISDHRITNLNDRGGSTATSYTAPDLATDSLGNQFLIWSSGTLGTSPLLYGASPNAPTAISELQIASVTNGYFDPAKITTAPNDDVWVFYTDRTGGESDIVARRKAAASASFDASVEQLKMSAGITESGVDGEVDSNGLLHVVWVDQRAGTHIFYGLYDPLTDAFVQEEQLTTAPSSYSHPCIALNSNEEPFIVFEQSTGLNSGQIWLVTSTPPSSVEHWNAYQ